MVSNHDVHPIAGWQYRHFVGGHPALDLTNTITHRVNPTLAQDRLANDETLCTWAISAGLMEYKKRTSAHVGPEDLVRVRKVRETAWALLNAVAANEPPPHWTLSGISEQASSDSRAIRLVPNASGQQLTVWGRVAEIGTLPSLLAWLTLEALLTLPPKRVRSCPRCGWLFYDSTRGGRRRWCSMRTCGNREKVARHYESHTKGR